MQYDLENRSAIFGADIIAFCNNIKRTEVSRPLISQIVRSATSIGANYMEANQASSRRDFINKIKICQKEASETKHWLRMISYLDESYKQSCRKFWQEAHELTLIFSKIARSSKN